MGEIVKLSAFRNPGNGALEAVRQYFDNNEYGRYTSAACALTGNGEGLSSADHMLAWLYAKGFIVVPIKELA